MENEDYYDSADIIRIVTRYTNAWYDSPSRQAVIFGCDCGCGGDSYTSEEWEALARELEEATKEMKAMCEHLNVIFRDDYV